MTFRLIFIVIFWLFILSASAQRQEEYCTVVYRENTSQFESWLAAKQRANARLSLGEIYRIPVVIHILHEGEPEGEGTNLSREKVEEQIRILNEDFRRVKGTNGFNDHPDGGDSKIEFVLAKTDPDGQATDGIVRVNFTLTPPPNFGGGIFLGAFYSIWDPNQYLNIWVYPIDPDGYFAGMATYPESDLPGVPDKNYNEDIPDYDDYYDVPVEHLDGILINTYAFGINNTADLNLGRTATHEIGHFLGLLHIWGNGIPSSCESDDFCEDTPPTAGLIYGGCSNTKIACDGRPAMVENYMEYTSDACKSIFTNDQIARMRTVLENSPRRKTLLTSPGLKSPEEVLGTPLHESESVKIYPNPVDIDKEMHIRFNKHSGRSGIRIVGHSISGEMLLNEIYTNVGKELILTVPRSLKEKVLFIRIYAEDLEYHQKVLLRR